MGPIKNRRFIDERPLIVDEKSRFGNLEIYTIIGKNRKHAVVSIIEHKIKFTILKKVSRKAAKNVTNAAVEELKAFAGIVLTITGDNGSEFAYHEQISSERDTGFSLLAPTHRGA